MKMMLLGLFVTTSMLCAQGPEKKHWDEYQKIMSSQSCNAGLPGDYTRGEIELLKDPEKVSLAMAKTGRDVGILYQDRFWIWVNDPVQFPKGNVGVYGRILSRASLRGAAGCAVIPQMKDGKIALICNFRHATRTWELEIPRGITGENEKLEACARREMLEETGFVADKLVFLGEMATDTGQTNAIVPIFLGRVEEQQEAAPEDSEAIDSIVYLTEVELCNGLKNGSLLLHVQGTERKVFLRDPFLTFALAQMGIRDLFSFGQANK